MHAMIMPNEQNRKLLTLLQREYISERFDFFMRETAARCMVVYPNLEVSGSKILLLMNKVILHHVIDKYVQDQVGDFMRTLQYSHFDSMIDLPYPYTNEFFTDIADPFSSDPLEDIDTMSNENSLRRSMSGYIGRLYKENTEQFNLALMDLMWVCHEQLPKRIRLHRVELTPNLSPMVLCEQQFDPTAGRFF
jgi:hypothetical protein